MRVFWCCEHAESQGRNDRPSPQRAHERAQHVKMSRRTATATVTASRMGGSVRACFRSDFFPRHTTPRTKGAVRRMFKAVPPGAAFLVCMHHPILLRWCCKPRRLRATMATDPERGPCMVTSTTATCRLVVDWHAAYAAPSDSMPQSSFISRAAMMIGMAISSSGHVPTRD